MKKKIPKVFANKVDSNGNNDNVFYSYEKHFMQNSDKNVKKNINQKINDIFNSSNYVYKADVIIKTRDGSFNKRIVGRNSSNLITIDNELVPISNIIDIENKN